MSFTTPNPRCETCGIPLVSHVDQSHEFRRPPHQMPRLGVSPHPQVPLGTYEHYKGGHYLVIGGALDASADHDSVLVLYVSIEEGYVGSRPVDNFIETVSDGERFTGYRFRRVS